MVAKRDYDGDGRVETNEQEIGGLLRALGASCGFAVWSFLTTTVCRAAGTPAWT